ncbi:MAG: cytochrome c3 family protein [Syntrophorhabdaceae bacterium]|nr:cytochrome c3 family protein [Syntrophorhabdaceae bacterium]
MMIEKIKILNRMGFNFTILISFFIFFSPYPMLAVNDEVCISCHEKRHTGEDKKEMRWGTEFIKRDLKGSVHRQLKCIQCHSDATSIPHKRGLSKVDCTKCHMDTGRSFSESVHGSSLSKGERNAPSCVTCHGDHKILKITDPRAPVFRNNQLTLCSVCHTDKEIQKKYNLPGTKVIKAYERSVHGRIIKEGKSIKAAVCTDCHGAHLILKSNDTNSKTNKMNIPNVCGRCHVEIYNEYKLSIHSKALKEGKLDSPSCTDCHGEHTLTLVRDPNATVYLKNIPTTCAKCHENQELIKKYRLPSDRYSSYIGSFHGVALKYGNVTTANCTSCHEVHRILPASDPESSIHPKNLSLTCGRCHPAMKNAANIGKIHVEAKKESSLGMYIVRNFYTWFIGIMMTLFVAYIILDVYGILRRRRNDKK